MCTCLCTSNRSLAGQAGRAQGSAKEVVDKLKAKGLFLFAMFSPSGLTTEVLSRLTIQPSRWLRRTRVCSFLGREAFVTTPLF